MNNKIKKLAITLSYQDTFNKNGVISLDDGHYTLKQNENGAIILIDNDTNDSFESINIIMDLIDKHIDEPGIQFMDNYVKISNRVEGTIKNGIPHIKYIKDRRDSDVNKEENLNKIKSSIEKEYDKLLNKLKNVIKNKFQPYSTITMEDFMLHSSVEMKEKLYLYSKIKDYFLENIEEFYTFKIMDLYNLSFITYIEMNLIEKTFDNYSEYFLNNTYVEENIINKIIFK